jgi:hypothetical protein
VHRHGEHPRHIVDTGDLPVVKPRKVQGPDDRGWQQPPPRDLRAGLDDQSGSVGDLREHLIVLDQSWLNVDWCPVVMLEIGDQQLSP